MVTGLLLVSYITEATDPLCAAAEGEVYAEHTVAETTHRIVYSLTHSLYSLNLPKGRGYATRLSLNDSLV